MLLTTSDVIPEIQDGGLETGSSNDGSLYFDFQCEFLVAYRSKSNAVYGVYSFRLDKSGPLKRGHNLWNLVSM